MSKIRVNIYDKAYVPSLGRGPFMNKLIHEELFRSLKRLGYVVEKVDETVSDLLIFETPTGDSKTGTEQPETSKEDTTPISEPSVGDDSTDSAQNPNPEAPKEDTTPVEHKDATAETQADVEVEKVVENKVDLTDEEVKFLTGKAKRDEIIDLLTEKGVVIENENATIAELLDLVGLKRK